MRLTLVIPALGAGGAERVMATLANAWVGRSWDVTIMTIEAEGIPPFYALDPAIHLRPLGIARNSPDTIRGIRNNVWRLGVLRRAIVESKPDVVVSFLDQTNVLVLAACSGLALPVVVAEHIDPAQRPLDRGWRLLRRRFYPRAARVVVLTASARAYFPAAIRRRTRVIPNPIVVDHAAEAPPEHERDRGGSRLIAAGRLVEQKGFDLLLRAFASVAPRHPGWSLDVWGEGPLRPALEALRDDLGLGGRVRFPGVTATLHREMRRADLFVLSSRYEGLPMVLGEAMACGLPVVSFDCPSGPRDMVRHGVDGLLVPPGDVPGLAAALARLMGDEAERRSLAAQAPMILDRFGLDRVLGEWDELFDEVRR